MVEAVLVRVRGRSRRTSMPNRRVDKVILQAACIFFIVIVGVCGPGTVNAFTDKEIKEFVSGDGWQEPDSVSSRPSRRHLLGGSVKFLGGVLELSDTPSAQMTVNGALTASSVTIGELR